MGKGQGVMTGQRDARARHEAAVVVVRALAALWEKRGKDPAGRPLPRGASAVRAAGETGSMLAMAGETGSRATD